MGRKCVKNFKKCKIIISADIVVKDDIGVLSRLQNTLLDTVGDVLQEEDYVLFDNLGIVVHSDSDTEEIVSKSS